MANWKAWVLVVPGMLSLGAGSAAGGQRPRTGFIARVHEGPGGARAKYVVFIPHAYDGKEAFPVILFLHGAGSRGTDGRAHLEGALARAIRKREKTFAFVAVFPQAQRGGWQARSADGKRALAILDEVIANYKVDTKRVYLTGLSMGGQGTWSLAAAHPRRWAAIVPICGGGDPRTAGKFKGVPCWCFHGDADEVIDVERSRAMVRALKQAGGRPLYHEYPEVGHNCWDLTYARADLYEWLMLQRLR